MSIFTSKKTEWRKGIETAPGSRTEYEQLKRQIGEKRAREFLELVYEKYLPQNKKQAHPITPDLAKVFLQKEYDNVFGKMRYVGQLVAQAQNGGLATELNNNVRAENDYYKNPTNGLNGRMLAIDKAANWICGNYAAGIPATKALLSEYIPAQAGQHGKAGPALGPTSKHIVKIHKRLFPDAPPNRFNYGAGDVKYPSTVGAAALMDCVFNMTAGMAWPGMDRSPVNVRQWESWAMFWMVALVTIQAFSDGNKRAGHAAYAIVLIKGTGAFKAPTTAKESELFRMNG